MISKDVKMDYEEVCAWFLARQALNKPSQLQKFSESCWRFVFYSVVWSYGVYILKDVNILNFYFSNVYYVLKEQNKTGRKFLLLTPNLK